MIYHTDMTNSAGRRFDLRADVDEFVAEPRSGCEYIYITITPLCATCGELMADDAEEVSGVEHHCEDDFYRAALAHVENWGAAA